MNPVDADGGNLAFLMSGHSSSLEVEIPPLLLASVGRHQANLARLLQSFREAGMDEAQIEAAVGVVIDSYKHELIQAIRTLTAEAQTAEDTR
jgi:hypothetical protein